MKALLILSAALALVALPFTSNVKATEVPACCACSGCTTCDVCPSCE